MASIVDERERCPGCNMTPDDAWHVAAEQHRCPTCAERDRIVESLSAYPGSRAGWRARFRQLFTEQERMTESAAVWWTEAGAKARQAWRAGN